MIVAPSTWGSTVTARIPFGTGKKTNTMYADSHAKTIDTRSIVSSKVIMENGAWRGALPGGGTPEGNKGWARDWQ
jgi:hypothetical protein